MIKKRNDMFPHWPPSALEYRALEEFNTLMHLALDL